MVGLTNRKSTNGKSDEDEDVNPPDGKLLKWVRTYSVVLDISSIDNDEGKGNTWIDINPKLMF